MKTSTYHRLAQTPIFSLQISP